LSAEISFCPASASRSDSSVPAVAASRIRQSLNEEQKDAVSVLCASLENFKAVYAIMPLQIGTQTFLLVAMEEGLGLASTRARPALMLRS
jgi:hypothetical protein